MWDWNLIIKILIFRFLIYADKMICMKRNKSRYECISIREKTIILFRWKFVIKRRCYFDNWNQEYVYLLDEWLGIKKHQHIPSNEIENMCKMVIKKMTFNQVMDCYWNCISINTIYRLIKNQPICYRVDFNTNPNNYQNIYVDIDDTYRNFRFNNQKQKCKEKVIHAYQEHCKGGPFINEVNAVIFNQVGFDSKKCMELTINQIKGILTTYYGDLSKFRIFIGGDGARYIKTIAKSFNAQFVLDLWHAIHEIELCFNTKELKDIRFIYDDLVDPTFRKETLKNTIIELVEKGEVVIAIKLLVNVCKRHNLHSKYLNGLIFYLRHNKKGIEIRKNPDCKGVFTETHIQQYGKSYFGNVGRCYSLESFMNILKARCLVFFLK